MTAYDICKFIGGLIPIFGITSYFLVGGKPQHRRIGFIMNLIIQIFWLIYAFGTKEPPFTFVIGAIVMGTVCVINLIRLK